MNRTILIALGLILPAQAMAWTHTFQAWTPDDFPLGFYVADDGSAESDCESSVRDPIPADGRGYCTDAATRGYKAWEDAECAEISSEFVQTCPNVGRNASNRVNYITFDDPSRGEGNPDGDIAEPGTLAVTFTTPQGTAFVLNGTRYLHSVDSDIVFNDNVLFDRHENITNGQCNGGTNFDGVMTHEIGHTLGMGHSCEKEDACLDQKLQLATMFWSEGSCGQHAPDINEDDIEGITALYGPYATFVCSHELNPGNTSTSTIGVVCPEGETCDQDFKLKCSVVSDNYEELDDASTTWDWGDGTTSTGLDVTHEYTSPGNFTVRANVVGNNETCGEWNYTYRRIGYVTACGIPDAALEVEHIDGLTYDLLNDTDISVYGCILDIQWDIYQGSTLLDSIQAWEPEYTFPDNGEYRIVLNVGGYAGTGAAELTFEAVRKRGNTQTCSSIGAWSTGGTFGLLLLAGMAARRRR
jgi:hypothetical protein